MGCFEATINPLPFSSSSPIPTLSITSSSYPLRIFLKKDKNKSLQTFSPKRKAESKKWIKCLASASKRTNNQWQVIHCFKWSILLSRKRYRNNINLFGFNVLGGGDNETGGENVMKRSLSKVLNAK